MCIPNYWPYIMYMSASIPGVGVADKDDVLMATDCNTFGDDCSSTVGDGCGSME